MVVSGRRPRGSLEAAILEVLSRFEVPVSSRQVHAELGARGIVLSLTTVITALQRLTKKALVVRIPGTSSRSWLFQAAQSAAERAADRMGDALGDATDREAALLRFAGSLADEDVAALRRALEGRS